MKLTLSDLLHLLQHASAPEDIFGGLPASDPQAALKQRYREFVIAAHPDHNPTAADAASQALAALHAWHGEAQRRLAQGIYGAAPRISAATQRHHYVGYQPPLPGDLCDLFPVDVDGAAVLLKVVRSPRNNDLLEAEARALQRIERALAGQAVRAHFPSLVEHFQLRDGAGVRRHTNVLRAERGYVSLAEVLAAYPGGLHPADAAWMFNRTLAALGVAHGLGIVHGAVLPAHLLVRPADHNGMLIDWCYSVPAGQPLKALSQPYAALYPPEVAARQPATPATDIYLAAQCMVLLLGGQGGAQGLPPHVPRPLAALLRACLIPAPQRRPDDAWQVFDDFREILGQLYGPPSFRPFHMPAGA